MGEGCVCCCGLKAKGLSCRKRGGGGSQDFIDGGKKEGREKGTYLHKNVDGKKEEGREEDRS